MKKYLIMTFMLLGVFTYSAAQKQAEIKFEKTTHDFGKFSENQPVQKCTFVFTNVGDAPLVINQAIASCGCTAPSYTKKPIQPGETGKIDVVYDGKGKYPGHFKKTITVRTNGKTEMTRIYVTGVMESAEKH